MPSASLARGTMIHNPMKDASLDERG